MSSEEEWNCVAAEEENEELIIIDDIGDWYKMEKINMIFEVFNQNSKYYKQMMDVIVAAKVNPPEKGQVHHIVPRCWFKHYNMKVDNSISNTVLLTWEDHKLVHNLAYKCAKEKWLKSKLAYSSHIFGDTDPAIDMCGSNNPMYGKHRSKEVKEKISKAMIGNKNCGIRKGEKNPSFGKIRSIFGEKFYEYYGFTKYKDPKLYSKEHSWYKRHGKCSWE